MRKRDQKTINDCVLISMPIESDEDAFTAICAMLGIGTITQLVGVSDETIAAKCSNDELTHLLIELKRETLRKVVQRLARTARASSAAPATPHSQTALMSRLQQQRYSQ